MAEQFLLIFTLAPVLRGFIAMMICGFSFPLCGVMVLRMDLVLMRYMLMHGVILGGAVALAMNLPVVPACILINLVLVGLMLFFTKSQGFGFSGASAGAMVFSMALASVIMHVKNVPAKDTLSLMWGSPFALTRTDLMIAALLALLLVCYVVFNFRNILTLFFNQDVAKASGIKVRLNYVIMVMIIALVVALAMKLLGAFLIDSLLILPVLTASTICRGKLSGIKNLFIVSAVLGFVFSLTGYAAAVVIDWPPAAVISLLSVVIFIISSLIAKIRKERK